ncbi:hypothetical protein MNBD_CHLOROFLEXI01-4135 [hydrothermal vent metagenome]|uniref:histidine kinase n=1 Tax=hydrothermal vent metagenome TaxID=652676 RepID=A0A3B0UFK9_9ZZZZ
MLKTPEKFSDSHQDNITTVNEHMIERIEKSLTLLNTLHEPWHQLADRDVQINDCLQQALRELFPQLRMGETAVNSTNIPLPNNHTLTVSLNMADDLPTVQTAPDMLSEAFRVVLKNGYEAILAQNKPGSLQVTSRLQSKNRLQIIIQDSGVGIRPEDIPHIFEMGWSGKKGSGMGFGLFWTRDFIHGLGGSLYVDSKPNQGTTFDISLPITS